MSTEFKIKCTQTNNSEWDVDLGMDILDAPEHSGKIREYATSHAIVVVQNDTKYALRHAEDDEQIIAVLKPVYPQVSVKPHVKAEPKAKLTEEQTLAKILGCDVSKITPEVMAKAKALAQ